MLRALGYNTTDLFATIFLQAFFFAFPGVFFGIIFAAIFNALARLLLFTISRIYSTYFLTTSSIWIGILIGFGIPIISNVFPIRQALGKNLRQSLDINHRKAGDIAIVVNKLKNFGTSLS